MLGKRKNLKVVIVVRLFKYEREKDARIAVIPRYGEVDSIMWFHIQPCVTYHLINCFEDGDEVLNYLVYQCRVLY